MGLKKERKARELVLLVTPHSSVERIKREEMSDRLLSWASLALHNSPQLCVCDGGGGGTQGLFQHHTKRKGKVKEDYKKGDV